MRDLHPTALFTYFISVVLLAAFVSDPVFLSEALLGGLLFFIFAVEKKDASDIGFYLPLFFMIAIANPLFSHNGQTPLFFMNGNPITLEATLCGIGLAVSVVGVLLWCRAFSEIMTGDKFLYLFGRPFPKTALILSSAMRFIPEFRRQIKKVRAAQKAMGFYSSDGFVSKIKSGARVFAAIAAWSLENSIITADSMRARGFGKEKRTNFSLFRFKKRDAAFLCINVCLVLITVIGLAFGAADFSYYPKISFSGSETLTAIVRAAFGILCFLPTAVEIKEALKWKFYELKI